MPDRRGVRVADVAGFRDGVLTAAYGFAARCCVFRVIGISDEQRSEQQDSDDTNAGDCSPIRDEFEKKTFEANNDGSIGLTVPHYVTGPNGEEIEPGDTVSVMITKVEKQGGTQSN